MDNEGRTDADVWLEIFRSSTTDGTRFTRWLRGPATASTTDKNGGKSSAEWQDV